MFSIGSQKGKEKKMCWSSFSYCQIEWLCFRGERTRSQV